VRNCVPASWEIARADAVCEKIQDGTHFSPKTQLSEGQFPYVTAKNVRPSGLDLRDLSYLTPEDHAEIYRRADVRQGDVLLVKDGVNAGDAAINTLPGEISLLSSVCFLRPFIEALHPGFLRYFLQSPLGNTALTGKLSGTAIRRIILRRVRELDIPIAPLPEQHRIVEAIEQYSTRLDDAVASLERVQRNLERYRASVLKAAVEGRLVPTEADLARQEGRTYEPADVLLERILAERKVRWIEDAAEKTRANGNADALHEAKRLAEKKYKEPQPPDTSGLPDLPEGWCWAGPDQLADESAHSLGIGPFGSNLRTVDYRDSGLPLVFVRNIRSEKFEGLDDKFVSPEKGEELQPHWAQPGDILITKMGEPPGDVCLYPLSRPTAVITADCIKLRVTAELALSAYVVSGIRSQLVQPQIAGITKGVAQKKVSLARFKTIGIPLPPRAEQDRIEAHVEMRESQVVACMQILTTAQERCLRLRQSILKWAFEGKLVEQNPDDEPASVLLEQIRAEAAEGKR